MSSPKEENEGAKNPSFLLTVGSGCEKYGTYITGILFRSNETFLYVSFFCSLSWISWPAFKFQYVQPSASLVLLHVVNCASWTIVILFFKVADFPLNLGSINSLNLSPDFKRSLLSSALISVPIISLNLSSEFNFEK